MHLKKIQTPDDLKRLKISELKLLAREIRSRIIEVLSKTGGHLASNLGSVELTIALHYVFDSPKDKFIFDVSHQTYTHKLLTGRNDARFDLIRHSQGLNGFAHPNESPHDHFFAGHAGTALSLALGMAFSRSPSNEDHIMPIVGDATFSCGLALEALNNIRKEIPRFIVVLNDNEMSISKNVGSISQILSRLLNNPTTIKLSHEFQSLVSKIPICGNAMAKHGHNLKESIQNFVSAAPFFEQFGLSYIGPFDGHDLKKMIPILLSVRDLPMPILIHFMTKKGHGVKQAEKDPITYHGVKSFDPKTCEFHAAPSKKPTFPKIFGKEMAVLGERFKNIAVVTPAMSLGSCLDTFREKYPERFFDVGIAEGHAVTFSGGLGKTKECTVVCSIYSTFLQRALDNLFQDVCLQEIPVIFAIDRAGLATGDGATHHGIYEMGFLRTMPNLVICQPRNGQLLKELLHSSLQWKRPTAIRYPNIETEEGTTPLQNRPIGLGEVLSEGEDLLIIALGHLAEFALKLKTSLAQHGIFPTVVDPIFVKPLDRDLLSKLLLTHAKVLTLEEHSLKGGLGAEVNEFLMENDFRNVQVLNLGVPEVFLDQGSYDELYEKCGLSHKKVMQKMLTHFSFSNQAIGELR